MKPASRQIARNITRVTALGLATLTGDKVFCQATVPQSQGSQPQNVRQFTFGTFVHEYENVLGTSMELFVRAANPLQAKECEFQVVGEIERLRQNLSTYDAASEIRRVMAGATVTSPELHELLDAYALWSQRTDGVINVNMGEVLRLWKNAGGTGRVPAPASLRAAAARERAYNVDALGKGYIIDRAVEVARKIAPAGLLNIGGDIRVWGGDTWLIGVANPFDPAENAAPLAQIVMREGAIATSGGYARNFTLGGKVFSHVLDARTLQPAARAASASMVAKDCVTANALSTAACVLGALPGAQLALQWGAIEHLIVDAAGSWMHSTAFAQTSVPEKITVASVSADKLTTGKTATPAAPTETPTAAQPASANATAASSPANTDWAKDNQVTINIALKSPGGFNLRAARRPYVAIWIESSDKKPVRTIAVWGNNSRYLSTLSNWWKASSSLGYKTIYSLARATRPAGQYSLNWDGLDDKGKNLPTGDYNVFVEINREHGQHVMQSCVIHVGGDKQTVNLNATAESDASKIIYGPKTVVAALETK